MGVSFTYRPITTKEVSWSSGSIIKTQLNALFGEFPIVLDNENEEHCQKLKTASVFNKDFEQLMNALVKYGVIEINVYW